MTSPCATCTCCHAYMVTVTGYDAWVIANGLRLAPEQFLVAVGQEEDGPHRFRLGAETRTYDLVLDKARARTKDKPCVFWLRLQGGVGRCGIYPYRPYVCRTYPAMMVDDLVERREDVVCPAGAWRDGTLDDPAWRRGLRRMQVEYDVYALAVARWNHHLDRSSRPADLGFAVYLAFLMRFYERLSALRSSIDEQGWDELADAWVAALNAGSRPLAGELTTELEPWAGLFPAIYEVAVGSFAGDLD